MTLRIKEPNEVCGARVWLRVTFWMGAKWYQASTHAKHERERFLHRDGSWLTVTGRGVFRQLETPPGAEPKFKFVEVHERLFPSVEEVETALALGALCEWNGHPPHPAAGEE